jgi:hypothetical protein
MPSSVIRAFDYDATHRRLTITFVSGDIYVYLGVPPETARGLADAPSKGAFFAEQMRDRLAVERRPRGG